MRFESFYSGSTGNLYRVSDGNTRLLIECGVPIKKIRAALDFKLGEIAACLVTHSHLDHAKAAADIMKAGIDLYCTKGTAEALGLSGHRLHCIKAGEQFAIDKYAILPFATEHDCNESIGFLIASGPEKLLFATDTFYLKYRFTGLTAIAIECNWSKDTISPDTPKVVLDRLYSSHFSLENVVEFLKANDLSKVTSIHLLHLSSDNSDEKLFKQTIERLTGIPVYVAQKEAKPCNT